MHVEKKLHSPQHRVVFLSLVQFWRNLCPFETFLLWTFEFSRCRFHDGPVSPRVSSHHELMAGVLGNITGLMAVVFSWRFCTLLCDARAPL